MSARSEDRQLAEQARVINEQAARLNEQSTEIAALRSRCRLLEEPAEQRRPPSPPPPLVAPGARWVRTRRARACDGVCRGAERHSTCRRRDGSVRGPRRQLPLSVDRLRRNVGRAQCRRSSHGRGSRAELLDGASDGPQVHRTVSGRARRCAKQFCSKVLARRSVHVVPALREGSAHSFCILVQAEVAVRQSTGVHPDSQCEGKAQ